VPRLRTSVPGWLIRLVVDSSIAHARFCSTRLRKACREARLRCPEVPVEWPAAAGCRSGCGRRRPAAAPRAGRAFNQSPSPTTLLAVPARSGRQRAHHAWKSCCSFRSALLPVSEV